MKKIIALLLLLCALCSAFALMGCDGCDDKEDDTDTSSDTINEIIVEDEHSHKVPPVVDDDVSLDYEME